MRETQEQRAASSGSCKIDNQADVLCAIVHPQGRDMPQGHQATESGKLAEHRQAFAVQPGARASFPNSTHAPRSFSIAQPG